MKSISITGDIKYIDLEGHIKEKSLNNEKLIEKELLETVKNSDNNIEENKTHKIYLLEKGLYPIREFIDVKASDSETQKYDEKIVDFLNDRIIERCIDLEI